MIKIKICGITNLEDAWMASESGADALGFNFYPKSPRYVSFEKARDIIRSLPPFILKVGVFVNELRETIQKALDLTEVDLIQLHGNESPKDCQGFKRGVIKVFRVDDAPDILDSYSEIAGILLDTPHKGSYGGTGRTFDWSSATVFKRCEKPLILSGGLGPDNILEAIEKVRPYGVDASSRLEEKPGKKNSALVKEFIRKIKLWNLDQNKTLL